MKPISNLSLADTTLRVLILEDDPDHAFVLQHRLQRDRGGCAFVVTSEETAFRNALTEFAPQIILADNSLPSFNAVAALRAVREWQPSAVCILVTTMLHEEQAVDFIRAGGDDCIDKIQLSRLCAAVNAALARRSRPVVPGKSERQYARRREMTDAYLDSSPDGMLTLDKEGFIMHMNESAGRLLSDKSWTPTGNLIWEVFPAVKGSFFEAAFHALLKEPQPLTIRMHLEERDSWLDCVFQPTSSGVAVLIRDVTREENLREQMRELQERFQQELDIAASLAAHQERHLLGQELHDNVNQLLASANLFLTLIRDSPERAVELIPYCTSTVSKAIAENRRIAHGLVSSEPGTESLLQHAEQLCESMLRPAGITYEFQSDSSDAMVLPVNIHLALYRILQEHCNNILRHAKASRVSMNFSKKNDTVQMTIADNGQGSVVARGHEGIGLRNIARRARELGGRIDISTSPGNGFVLHVQMPL